MIHLDNKAAMISIPKSSKKSFLIKALCLAGWVVGFAKNMFGIESGEQNLTDWWTMVFAAHWTRIELFVHRQHFAASRDSIERRVLMLFVNKTCLHCPVCYIIGRKTSRIEYTSNEIWHVSPPPCPLWFWCYWREQVDSVWNVRFAFICLNIFPFISKCRVENDVISDLWSLHIFSNLP